MFWTRLLRPFRFQPYEGGGGLPKRISHRLRRMRERCFFYAEAFWLVRDLREEIPIPLPEIDVEFRQAGSADLHLFPPAKVEEATENLALGDMCFMALHEGKLVYYHWVRTRPSVEGSLEITVEPSEGEVYFSDGYTDPAYRGLRLHSAVPMKSLNLMKERGYRTATSIVLTNNHPSRRSLARMGWRVSGKIAAIRWGRKRRTIRFPSREEV